MDDVGNNLIKSFIFYSLLSIPNPILTLIPSETQVQNPKLGNLFFNFRIFFTHHLA
ncbi:hypothetical protein RchiOBHm_Chr4g0385281 [Rosa chinensis]|uniref:Uncharacterized protein n=1 Tax=Rosa chinensis TaxID=74649 RepID=A0A2P6QNW5_ROSCH|nr:hypothetical protein RchiOBHm_Chr4g0385281 [Rosa chinensis]